MRLTQHKVIVARSYVAQDAAVYDTPDDYSARDHMATERPSP